MKKLILVLATINLSLFSCTNLQKNTIVDSQKEYHFELNSPIDTPIKYQIVNATEITQEVDGKETSSENKITIGIEFRFKKISDTTYLANILYNQFELFVKTDQYDQTLDASKAKQSYVPSEKIFSALDNAQFTAIISKKGNISSITGIKELTQRMKELAAGNTEALDIVNNSAQQYTNESLVKTMLEQTFKQLPPQKLKLGESWQVIIPYPAELNIPITTEGRLKNIEGGIATIEYNSVIKIEDLETTIGGFPSKLNLKGEQKGGTEIDYKTGLLQKSITTLFLTGKIGGLTKGISVKIRHRTNTTRM